MSHRKSKKGLTEMQTETNTKKIYKTREVWRDADGNFAKKPVEAEPQLEQPQKDNAGVVIWLIIASSFMLLLTPAWFLGMPVVGTTVGAVSYRAYSSYKAKPKTEKLVINYYSQ